MIPVIVARGIITSNRLGTKKNSFEHSARIEKNPDKALKDSFICRLLVRIKG